MAVNGCISPVPYDNDEDEDGPAIFKRPSSSKNGQINSSLKKPASQNHYNSSLGRTTSNKHSSNGENSNSQKNKAISAVKISNQNPRSTSLVSRASVPVSNVKSTHLQRPHSEAENTDDSDDDKPLTYRLNSASAASQKSNSMLVERAILDSKSEFSYDSDDNRPLSSKSLPAVTEKGSKKEYSDDSEDDKPLLSRLPLKSTSASKVAPNASIKKESSSDLGFTKGLNKRPLGDSNSSIGPSIKKPKIFNSSASVKVKDEGSVKEELKTEDDDDDIPLSQRLKNSQSSERKPSSNKIIKKPTSSFKKDWKKMKKSFKNSQFSKRLKVPPGSGGGKKWTTLEHNGVIFPPPYAPHGVKMLYNGQPVDLTPEQEEVATMFAVMKDTDYATKPKFIENFWNDWRQILGKNHVIKKFELCDFTPIYEWHLREKEKKKQMSSEEKKALKEEKLKKEEKYMWAIVDGVKEKVGNFRVEPPGLFRGRGEHPKMGKLKRRIRPSDITINIGKDAPIPECPILGERWKEIKHDNTVTWLAFWPDPINSREFKYVFLAASSSLKGQSDKEKYEKARLLKDYIHTIRENYTRDFTSRDATKRQIAVATYLIDKLALRAGNEKDDDEADTVGCCTLKVENVVCVPPNKLQFDFLGKDSIRYFNTVEVELPVYKAIEEFRTAKKSDGKRKSIGDDLFDLLDTSKLNAHLKELMPGLTAKVFRTYNASITLDNILNKETKEGTLPEKIAVYQHANKEVAIICNHQRSVSKSHESQMSKLNEKINDLKALREELKVDLSRARKGKPPLKDKEGTPKKNLSPDAIEKKLSQTEVKIEKMEIDKKIKEDLKTVALGTSKINYLDPRISVAWCKRHEVPIEKIFNKSLLAKFAWAMDVDPGYRF
ncbi:DNA topoisomerase 1 alpha-like isoform X1 [Ananas comosus]|uniref:DNA topoisomerase I n=1 Tax=Ananas comosus TaxID=4615 RepID=A0A199VIJ3_ANACO|nr:DNA topoisomerase 1 alpha-like isoform X1 [Ananas comosus]OAY76967.1 DNA topoisomerase 1 [Ananas comosus]